MQFISTRIHGAQDHLVAALMLCAPWVLGLEPGSAQALTLIVAGVLLAAISLLTNYEWGLIRRIPVPVHSAMDLLLGVALGAAPWLLGFATEVWAPHAALGAVLVLGALTIQPRPFGMEHSAFVAARLGAVTGGR
jgi:hypothetical protein